MSPVGPWDQRRELWLGRVGWEEGRVMARVISTLCPFAPGPEGKPRSKPCLETGKPVSSGRLGWGGVGQLQVERRQEKSLCP